MILEIDNREPAIIKEYFGNASNSSNINNACSDFTITFKNLEQGDFIIKDSNENILLLFERKTISDLLSSIKDNRYQEQSERYSELDIPNNNIYYIIEGNLNNLIKDSTDYKTVYSCIFSLTYKKQFSLLTTINEKDSIKIIEEFMIRINTYVNKMSNANGNANGNTNGNGNGSNLKLIKKQSVTKSNIDSYMLNLIPGIGINTAEEILKIFDGKLYNLIYQLKNNNEYFNNLINNTVIKSRKLSKKIINNIKEYLV